MRKRGIFGSKKRSQRGGGGGGWGKVYERMPASTRIAVALGT